MASNSVCEAVITPSDTVVKSRSVVTRRLIKSWIVRPVDMKSLPQAAVSLFRDRNRTLGLAFCTSRR